MFEATAQRKPEMLRPGCVCVCVCVLCVYVCVCVCVVVVCVRARRYDLYNVQEESRRDVELCVCLHTHYVHISLGPT